MPTAKPAPGPKLDLKEAIACYQHEAWASWVRFMFGAVKPQADGSFVITPELAARWRKQANTVYSALSETERGNADQQADAILNLIKPEE